MAEWKYVKIGDVCTVERGGSPRPIDKFITEDENGVNWIKIGDTTESMYITETAQKIIPEGMKKSRYVQPGDLLLSNSMSFGRPYIMKIDGCIHDGWLVLRDENNLFDKRFLYYYLSAPSTYQKLKNMAVGGVVNNLNSKMVREVSVPLPLMNEQLKIISVLSSLENLIIGRKKQLNKLDELVKSRFIEMFGDPITNKMGWEKAQLNTCIESIDNGKSPICDTSARHGNCPAVLKLSAATYGFYRPEENKAMLDENQFVEDAAIRAGDLLFTRKNTPELVGMCAYVYDTPSKLMMPDLIFRLNTTKRCNKVFLWKLINHDIFRSCIQAIATGSAKSMSNISKERLLNLEIILPPVELQNQFADFVAQVDKSKLAVQKSLEQLEILKKALMQEYFG